VTDLIAFDVYRTESLSISGRQLTARFLLRKDQEAYELLVSDESTGEVWKCGYTAETARDFASQTGEGLEQHVYSILKSDIEDGIGHSEA
jgi:hypothetical protein